MVCRYTYKGKTYEATEFDDVLRAMSPMEASKFMVGVLPMPLAPFVTNTGKWVDLALKRVMLMAAQDGYERVAFITGQQAADLYDLSKRISSVTARKDGEQFQLLVEGMDGEVVMDSDYTADQLPDVIGKELAQKIVDDGGGEYTGLDLQVGGEGMKTFYDQIIPQAAAKMVKKLGGGKIEDVSITFDPNIELDAWEPTDGPGDGSKVPTTEGTQPGFDITDAMREKLAGGMPLFSARDRAEAERAGFDTSKTWYHGTTARDFKAFRAGKGGVDELGVGLYFTGDPQTAEAWAGRADQGGRIIPVFLRKGDIFDAADFARDASGPLPDFMSKHLVPLAQRIKARHTVTEGELRAAQIMKAKRSALDWTDEEARIVNQAGAELWRTWLMAKDKDLASNIQAGLRYGALNAWLDRAGYVGMVNKNTQIRDQVVVFRPENVRSPWAKFSEKRAGSGNILLSARETREAIKALSDMDRDTDSFYDDASAMIQERAESFAKSNGVRLEMQPWSPSGMVTGVEITDLYADAPGSGGGTKVMEHIAAMADAAEMSVYLRPESARNREFYGRFGFQKDQRNFGFMARYPAFVDDEDSPRFSARPPGATWDMPEPTRFDNVVYKMQDKLVDLKRVVESITSSVGAIAEDINAYLQEEMFHGRASKRTADFGSQELQPMIEKMAADGLTIEDVEEYLHARHAKEANKVIADRNPGVANLQDGGSGMENAEADAYFAALTPELERKLRETAVNVDAIIDRSRQLYVGYSLESQDTVDSWKSLFQNYIPLQREEKEGTGGMGIGQGMSIRGRETQGRTGSRRKVVNILGNIAQQRERLILRGEKNRVATALIGLAQASPNPDFWTVGPPPAERVYDPRTNTVVERVDPMWRMRANVVTAKIAFPNGEIREMGVVFDEDNPRALRLAGALKNLDAGNLEGLLSVSAKITRYFAAINTQYNPVFGVVNLIRDVQGAMINLGDTPLASQRARIAKDTFSALSGIYGDVRAVRRGGQANSQWANLWNEFQEVGGRTGFRELFRTGEDRADALKNILRPDAWMDTPAGKVFTAGGALKVPMGQAKKGADWIFGWLSDYNDALENGVRLSAYKAGLDQGMTKKAAASLAKNLTVNFNRRGQMGMQAGAVYAFFNAAMQGTARMGQLLFDMEGGDVKTLRLSKTGKKVVYGGILLGSIQALTLAAAGFSDEDPPKFQRERSLIIPTGGKTYLAIPMPLGLHVIPGIGRHATEFALGGFQRPQQRMLDFLGMFADSFNPIGNAGMSMQTLAPTALDPLVALTENKDWTGKPIARESMNRAIPGHTLHKDTATTLSKVLAEAINTISGGNEYVAGVASPTPDQIDYLIGQLTGGVGRELSKVEQSVLATARGEELATYKVPLFGRFVGNAGSQASEGTAFFANTRKLNTLETEVKGLRGDGKILEAQAMLAARPDAYLIGVANTVERQVQRLRKEKRALIDRSASRAEVKAVEVRITEAMARLNRAAERLEAAQSVAN